MARKYYSKEYDLKVGKKKIHIIKYILPLYVEDIIDVYKVFIQEEGCLTARKEVVIRNKIEGSIKVYLVGKRRYRAIDDEEIKKLIQKL